MKIAMLDQLADRLASIERRRSDEEAPIALTNAYVDCLFAVGYARAGASDVASDRCRSAREALADQLGDRVHAWLVDAFSARVDLAIAGRAIDPFDDALADRLESLDHVSRYKVDRLRETARLLEPEPGWLDAISDFKYMQPSAVRRAGREVETADERMRRISTALGSAITGIPEANAIARCLASTTHLPDAFALECLDRALLALGRLAVPRMEAFEAAFSIGQRLKRLDRIPPILDALRAASDRLPVFSVAYQLHDAASMYHRAGDAAAAASLATELEAFAAAHPQEEFPTQAAKFLRDELAEPWSGATTVHQLRAIRASATATKTDPLEEASAKLLVLADQFGDITDSFGTNTHFSINVLEFVDALVSGVVDRSEAATS